VDVAVRNGCVETLEWWRTSGFPVDWMRGHRTRSESMAGRLNVLEWWKQHALPLGPPKIPIQYAADSGSVPVLQWLKDHGVTVPCTQDAIHAACKNTAVLQWFKENATAFSFNSETVIAESIGDLDVLQWWKQSGLNVEWPSSVSMYAICWKATNHASVLQWWRDNG
ncbi:hypothetical protein DFJ73DRAFT_602141, partial [Zopfochytrium polystomum]